MVGNIKMKLYKFYFLNIFSSIGVLFLGCVLNPQKQTGQFDSEYRISQDRKSLDEIRKEIPTEKRQTNDELALILSTLGNGEKDSFKAREEWQNILRKKRNKFDDSVQKQRNDFSRIEKSNRDSFVKKLERDKEDFQKKKSDPQERSEFYQQLETQRRDYFSEEQIKRSNFEAEIRDQRSEFEDHVREKNNLFNDELRALEKREEARKKLEHKINKEE
jgi:hypothetical protein